MVLWIKSEILGSNQHVQKSSGEEYDNERLKPSVKHGGGTVMGGAWGNNEHRKVPTDFDPLCNTVCTECDWWHSNFSTWQWSQTHELCGAYLDKKKHSGKLSVMDWSPHSLHLNIIEAVCKIFLVEQNKRHPTSKRELWACFRKHGEVFLKTT